MRLPNGIETIELGATSWRIMINANFEKLYTKDEIEAKFKELNFGDVSVTPATDLPERPNGFIKIKVAGKTKKVPFYDE